MSGISRGEYRPIYRALLTDPGFLALTSQARHCLMTLKIAMPACGIDVNPVWDHTIAAVTGLSLADVRAAFAELENTGWVKTDGMVLWIVNGLNFEPSLSASQYVHRRHVAKHIAGLPKTLLSAEFYVQYPQWCEANPLGPTRAPVGAQPGAKGKGKGKKEKSLRETISALPAVDVPAEWTATKDAVRGLAPIAAILPAPTSGH